MPGNGDRMAEACADQLACQHVLRRARRELAAIAQQQRVRRARREFFEVVSDQDDGEFRLAGAQRSQAHQQLLAPGDIQPGGWLIKQQHLRGPHQGTGNQRAASLALREHGPPGAREAAESHEDDRVVGPGRLGRCWGPARCQVERARCASQHQVPHCPGWRYRVVRTDQADQRTEREDIHPPESLAEDLDVTARGVGIGSQQSQQHALACAVRAEQGPQLAGPHRQRDLVQQQTAISDQVDATYLDHIAHQRASVASRA
jgi:hypothetical protein